MVESGKRSLSQREYDEDSKSHKRKTYNNRDKTKGGEMIVYRILCPDSVIGSVIGKSGKVINSIRQDTHARIKVGDPFPGAHERVITIYCYVKDKENVEVDEEHQGEEPLCAAQDALLRVHAAIVNALYKDYDSNRDRIKKDMQEVHMLAPSSQAANVIGKSGATIKKMRSKTRANIKISPKDITDPAHSYAMSFDNFILILGDAEAVKKALYAVSAIMYKFPPKEDIPLENTIPEAPPSIIIPSDVPIYTAGGFYSSTDSSAHPQHVSSLIGAAQHVPERHGYADMGSSWPTYSSNVHVVSDYGGSSQSEELVVRLLCPINKIGRVIGKGGNSIKSVRQETGARIEVDDTKGDHDECLITITSAEAWDDLKSMAVEAVLLLQEKINDSDDKYIVNIRLLVSSKIIGCVIGKSGAIINEIQKRTRADVRILKNKKPACAQDNDELVEVNGEVSSVRDALIQVILRLRDDALNRDGGRDMDGGCDREGGRDPLPPTDSMYSGSGISMHNVLPTGPSVAPLGYDHRVKTGSGYGMLSSGSVYGYEPLAVGDNGYGLSSYSSKAYSGLMQSSTLEMVVPGKAVGKVMGRGGANMANIRKISGASVDILDSKSSCSDRVALISGTPEQKRAAENLIQAFIMAI